MGPGGGPAAAGDGARQRRGGRLSGVGFGIGGPESAGRGMAVTGLVLGILTVIFN